MLCPFVVVLGGMFFLATALFFLSDRAKAEQQWVSCSFYREGRTSGVCMNSLILIASCSKRGFAYQLSGILQALKKGFSRAIFILDSDEPCSQTSILNGSEFGQQVLRILPGAPSTFFERSAWKSFPHTLLLLLGFFLLPSCKISLRKKGDTGSGKGWGQLMLKQG